MHLRVVATVANFYLLSAQLFISIFSACQCFCFWVRVCRWLLLSFWLFAFNAPRNRDVFCREFVKRDAAKVVRFLRFALCLFVCLLPAWILLISTALAYCFLGCGCCHSQCHCHCHCQCQWQWQCQWQLL